MCQPSSVHELGEIAVSTAPLRERAQAVLQTLSRCVPSDGAWLALSDPRATVYGTVGSTGLDRSVVDYLDGPSVAEEIRLTGYNRDRPPISVAELAVAPDELPTWAECLLPAGFRDALGVALFEPGGPHLGVLSLLSSSREAPSVVAHDRLAHLAPLVARAVSPMRSLLATARLVQGASAGVLLLDDGTTYPLPGLEDHTSLGTDPDVVGLARELLRAGQVYRSFLWPGEGPEEHSHVRITVLAATEMPAPVLGMLLVTPAADCRGLTPRELEVLGLVVDGCSNQQIANRLGITPRTVATHVEHILAKLGASSRTSAGVRAEREGCYVPAVWRTAGVGRR